MVEFKPEKAYKYYTRLKDLESKVRKLKRHNKWLETALQKQYKRYDELYKAWEFVSAENQRLQEKDK